MAEVIPKDSRYIPLTQQRWCCVPTCIQIVMLRHNIPLVPAELLGHEMGLIVPEDELKYFWHGRTGPRPPAGYGTQIGKPQYGPNAVFKKLNIPLKMTWTLINKFRDRQSFVEYLKNIEQEDKDILVCYDWGMLFDIDGYQGGHVCVLDIVLINSNQVRLIDPEADAPKWRLVDIEKLYMAMKHHGKEKSGGFWELHKIS